MKVLVGFDYRRSVVHVSKEFMTCGMSRAAEGTMRSPKARWSAVARRCPSASHKHQAMAASWLRNMPANAETSAGPLGPPPASRYAASSGRTTRGSPAAAGPLNGVAKRKATFTASHQGASDLAPSQSISA